MKISNISLALSLCVVLSISGCGLGEKKKDDATSPSSSSNSSSTTTPTPTPTTPTGSYTVNAVDEAIIGSGVSAPECASFEEEGAGVYTLKECISKPSVVRVINGFVDTNGNGVQDDNETAQAAPLQLKVAQSGASDDFIVSPLTTLASQGTDLSALAVALGISESDLFTSENTEIQRAVNAMLIAARQAGITKFDSFVADMVKQLQESSKNGLAALEDVKNYMDTHQSTYQEKYGVVFGGFVQDTSSLDFSNAQVLQDVHTIYKVPAGSIRLGGFIYDAIIPDADITIYENNSTTVVATGKSDAEGSYEIDINASVLDTPKVLRLEAIAGKVKFLSYVTSDELQKHMIGRRVSSGNLEDLVVSNITTAKAVLIEKSQPEALSNVQKMSSAKALVESLYSEDVLKISAVIKDVVDNNATLGQTATDTLELAQSMIDVNATTQIVTTTLPSDVNQTAVNIQVEKIQNDPLLSTQLQTTESVPEGSLRAIMENNTLFGFDYHSEYQSPFTYQILQVHQDGSTTHNEYKYDSNSSTWRVFQDMNGVAGSLLWSSDGAKMYDVSPEWIPAKRTLLAQETLNILGNTVNIYHIQEEITAEPGNEYFANFVTDANDRGTINFSSMNDSVKGIKFVYSNGDIGEYHLDDNGTYYHSFNPNRHYKYHTLEKDINGTTRTFVVFDDGETHDGGGSMIYLDFAEQKAYKKDYHNIGYTARDIMYSGEALLNLWKNLPPVEQNRLKQMIDDAHNNNVVYSATNTWYQVTKKAIYEYVKSLSGREGLKKLLAGRELYQVANNNASSSERKTLYISQDFDYMEYNSIDENGTTTTKSYPVTSYSADSFTLKNLIVVRIKEITDEYILISIFGVEKRIYFDKAKEEAYIQSVSDGSSATASATPTSAYANIPVDSLINKRILFDNNQSNYNTNEQSFVEVQQSGGNLLCNLSDGNENSNGSFQDCIYENNMLVIWKDQPFEYHIEFYSFEPQIQNGTKLKVSQRVGSDSNESYMTYIVGIEPL